MASEIKANKISPATGTAFTIGDSGDTFTVPSGCTIVNSGTATGFGEGKVLQIPTPVHKTDSFSTSSTSWVDVTDVTLSITPSATSSRILVLLNSRLCGSSGYPIFAQFLRDSTAIGSGTGTSNVDCFAQTMPSPDSTRYGRPADLIWLDSPNTTSSVTYKMQVRMYASQTGYVNRATDLHIYAGEYATSLTLMEIGT